MFLVSKSDKEIIYSLACRTREIADLAEMEDRRQRWCDHNSLKAGRPLVLSFPEGAWVELLPADSLECEDELLRQWEMQLRRRIYWWENICDDYAEEPIFEIPWCIDRGNFGVEKHLKKTQERGSYTWDKPIKDLDADFSKLSFRKPVVDRQETQRRVELAEELFKGALDVQLRGDFGWSMGLTWPVIDLIGLEQLMLAMYDNPAGLHRLMKWMSDEHGSFLDWFEEQGLITLNNKNGYTGSGGVAYTKELPAADFQPGSPVRFKDVWGFAESQETVGVSPEMFEEFVLPYQMPLLERFGLNCYGCCEVLNLRWEHIKKVPNLRRISVSPWANMPDMAENLGRNYIYSRKQNPTPVCTSFDEALIRKELRDTLDAAGDCVLEIIMKDTTTVSNEPKRIGRWVEIAMEEIDRFVS